MKKRKFRQGLAVAVALFMTINYAGSYLGRSPVVSMADTAATVGATSLNVRSGPGTTYPVSGKLTYGAAVSVVSETTGSDGKVWYQIHFAKNGVQATGYVRSDYIKFPTTYQSDENFERYLTNQGFPESYKAGLRQIHAEYPNWIFTAQHTNLDWKEVIDNESVVGRNLVPGNSPSSWKSTAAGAYNWETGTWPSFDSGSWVAASEDIISYYMDPRNFLNEKYLFQFLIHKYNSNIHTIDGIKNMVEGTFLDNTVDVSGSQSSTNSGSIPSVSQGPGASADGPGTGGQSSGSGASGNGGPTGGSSGSAGSGATGGNPGGTGNSGTGTAGNTGPGVAGSGQNPVVQPGVSPGSDSSGAGSGSGGSGGSGAGSSQGNSGSSGNTSPGSTGSGSGGVGTEAPGGSGNSDVSLQAPGASVSRNKTWRVGTAVGPGMAVGPGVSSSDDTYSAPIASYAEIIMNAASQSGVNPYVLTAMILQEQGSEGSRGVSGTVAGYEGYYNFFNIEAYKSGNMEAIERGLWYASQSGSYERPWNSVEKAILGGALYYGTNYVGTGQDTFYLKKFNVQGSNLYKHQYMTNVQAAVSEGVKLEEAYSSQIKQLALEFKIPVYKNMPDSPCPLPGQDGSPNNRLSQLSVDGFVLTPSFNRDITVYNLIVDSSVTMLNVRATALDSKAVITGLGNIQLQAGNQDITVEVKAQNGASCVYVIHVVRPDSGNSPGTSQSSGGPGASGSGPGGGPSGSGVSIEIITEGPEQNGGGSQHTGPGGSNVTIVQ